MLDYLPSEVRLGELSLRGFNFCNTHLCSHSLHLSVQLLGEQTAVHADVLRNRSIGAGHIHLHNAEVLLRRQNLKGFGGVVRSDHYLEEDGLHTRSNLCREGAVHSHYSAVDADLVGLISRLPGFLDGLSHSSAAGIHMLEGHAERLLEVAKHVQCRVCVLDIVVGEFLSLNLLGECQRERSGLESGIEPGALVRVLAVAQTLLEIVLQEEFLVQAGLCAHIGGDAGIILGCVRVGLGRQLQASLVRGLAIRAKLRQHGIIIRRITDDSHILPVLSGAAHHRRTAYVDVLDGVFHRDSFLRYGLAERIEVHANQLYCLDSILLQGLHVLRHVPAGKNAAMDLRVQGFHTAVTDLRESGDLADAYGLHTFFFQQFLGSPGGDYFPTEVHKTFHKRDETRFVRYTN